MVMKEMCKISGFEVYQQNLVRKIQWKTILTTTKIYEILRDKLSISLKKMTEFC